MSKSSFYFFENTLYIIKLCDCSSMLKRKAVGFVGFTWNVIHAKDYAGARFPKFSYLLAEVLNEDYVFTLFTFSPLPRVTELILPDHWKTGRTCKGFSQSDPPLGYHKDPHFPFLTNWRFFFSSLFMHILTYALFWYKYFAFSFVTCFVKRCN